MNDFSMNIHRHRRHRFIKLYMGIIGHSSSLNNMGQRAEDYCMFNLYRR
jgi:hypothetical protein